VKNKISIHILCVITSTIFLLNCSGSSSTTEVKENPKTVQISSEQRKKNGIGSIYHAEFLKPRENLSPADKQNQLALQYDTTSGIYLLLQKIYVYLNKLSAALTTAQKAWIDSSLKLIIMI